MSGYKSETVTVQVSLGAFVAAAAAVYLKYASWMAVGVGAIATAFVMRRLAAGRDCKALQRKTNLSGKVAIVTGANAGIGYYTALQLAETGCLVVITCRNAALTKATGDRLRADAAKRGLLNAGCTFSIIDTYSLECDDFESIKKFVAAFLTDQRLQLKQKGTPQLDILVNNAGMMLKELRYSKFQQRLEMHTAVNFLGPVLLTELLIGTVKRSGGRVVNVASEAHRVPGTAKLTAPAIFDALVAANVGPNAARGPLAESNADFRTAFLRYGTSKLLNIYYSHYIAAVHAVPVCSLHPGVVTTAFARDLIPSFIMPLYDQLSLLWCKTCEEGSQTTVYAAICDASELAVVLPERVAPYFVECRNQTRSLLRDVGWSTETAMKVVTDFALKELAPFLR